MVDGGSVVVEEITNTNDAVTRKGAGDDALQQVENNKNENDKGVSLGSENGGEKDVSVKKKKVSINVHISVYIV